MRALILPDRRKEDAWGYMARLYKLGRVEYEDSFGPGCTHPVQFEVMQDIQRAQDPFVLRNETVEKVDFIIASAERYRGQEELLKEAGLHVDPEAGGVPVLLVSGDPRFFDKEIPDQIRPSRAEWAAELRDKGAVLEQLPIHPRKLVSACVHAIINRQAEEQKQLKEEATHDPNYEAALLVMDHYRVHAIKWKYIFDSLPEECEDDHNTLAVCRDACSRFLALLDELGNIDALKNTPASQLRDKEPIGFVVHEVNNILAALAGAEFLVTDQISPEDAESVMSVVDGMHPVAEKLGQAMLSAAKGASKSEVMYLVEAAGSTEEGLSPLKLARKDLNFVVIDDDLGVVGNLQRHIELASNGQADFLSASDTDGLAPVSGDVVILLDNDLGDGKLGHQLIDELKQKFPDALIVVHTGNVRDQKAMEPYHDAGLVCVGKMDFGSLSSIINSKFPA